MIDNIISLALFRNHILEAGIVLTIVSFFIMETRFMKGAGITIKEFQTNMRNYILNRIKKRLYSVINPNLPV